MSLNRSPESKVVLVQIICVVEIQSESAWALTNIASGNTSHAEFHASEASGSEEEDFNIFCVFLCFKPRTSIFSSGGHFVHQSRSILAALVEGHLSYILIKFE